MGRQKPAAELIATEPSPAAEPAAESDVNELDPKLMKAGLDGLLQLISQIKIETTARSKTQYT